MPTTTMLTPKRLQRDAKSIAQQAWSGATQAPIVNVISGFHRRLVIPCNAQTSPTVTSSTTITQDQIDGSRLNSRRNFGMSNRVNANSTATMANNLNTNASNGNRISLVVFHKDSQLDTPIFVADARNSAGSLRDSRQVISLDSLRNRAHVESDSRQQQPVLVIEDPQSDDSGFYTCTLEFVADPTRTHQVRVQVISKLLHLNSYI